jgi:hypothetical protein
MAEEEAQFGRLGRNYNFTINACICFASDLSQGTQYVYIGVLETIFASSPRRPIAHANTSVDLRTWPVSRDLRNVLANPIY